MFTHKDIVHADHPAPSDTRSASGGFGLMPWVIVAAGPDAAPAERMIGLQMAVYRLITALELLRLPGLPRHKPAPRPAGTLPAE